MDSPAILASGIAISIDPKSPQFLGCGPKQLAAAPSELTLECNILVLRHAHSCEKPIVIISLDALYAGPKLRRDILRELGGSIDSDNLVLAASHTHFAPMLDDTKPELGEVEPQHYRSVRSRIIIGIRKALTAPGVPVSIRTSSYFSGGIVSRRRHLPVPTTKNGFSGTRAFFLPRKPSISQVRSEIIELVGGEGPVAVFWCMPCHPVSSYPPEVISADYIGVARSKYRSEKNVSQNFPFIFLQGPSADLRPAAVGWRKWSNPKGILFNLLLGRTFVPFSGDGFSQWAESRARELMSNLPRDTHDYQPVLRAQRCEARLDALFSFEYDLDRFVSLSGVRVGKVLLVGVSAEISESLSHLIEDFFPGVEFILSFSCIDDTFGYALTDSDSKRLGYEVDGFTPVFGLQKQKGSSLEKAILQIAKQVSEQLVNN